MVCSKAEGMGKKSKACQSHMSEWASPLQLNLFIVRITLTKTEAGPRDWGITLTGLIMLTIEKIQETLTLVFKRQLNPVSGPS